MADCTGAAAVGIPDLFAVSDDDSSLDLRFAALSADSAVQIGQSPMREDRLKSVRQAIEAGAYDDDDLLRIALANMIRSLQAEPPGDRESPDKRDQGD